MDIVGAANVMEEFHDFVHIYEDIFREIALAKAPKRSALSR